MEKEALLSVIVNNLRELEMMVESFKGKDPIIPAFIKLTLTKLDNVKQEIELLQQVGTMMSEPKVETKPLTDIAPEPVKMKAEILSDSSVQVPVVNDASVVAPAVNENVLEIEPEKPIVTPPVITQSTPIENVEPVIVADIKTKDEPIISTPKVENPVAEHPSYHHDAPAKPRHATLGDTLGSDKKSLVDKIVVSRENSGSGTLGMPVDDIRKAIGINDRFLFARELFAGNNSLMDQTILQLNGFSCYDDACQFVAANFNWQTSDATVQSFMSVVKRRFI